MKDRTWLITGASSGFGRAIAEAALARGDRVVATARRVESLGDLAGHERAEVVQLDVTDAGQRSSRRRSATRSRPSACGR